MTEAIENEFIPLAIFNNKKGKDLEVLNKYNEPTWNNPVVRIVNSKGENIVNRLTSDYSPLGLYNTMTKALEASENIIPEYFKILGKELSTTVKGHKVEESFYSMYCFWTGEKELGSQSGVLVTKAGFIHNAEVVRVIYDANEISRNELDQYAKQNKMVPIKDSDTFHWAKGDEDYFLRNSDYKYLPLSEVQKTKINSALGQNKSGLQYLSPKQQRWLSVLDKAEMPISYDQDFFDAWNQLLSSN